MHAGRPIFGPAFSVGVAVSLSGNAFDEADDISFQTVVVKPVDLQNAARADAVDFHQVTGNIVDPHTLVNQRLIQ